MNLLLDTQFSSIDLYIYIDHIGATYLILHYLDYCSLSVSPDQVVLVLQLNLFKVILAILGPLYSCLENPMDRGAWQATVCRVARVGHDLASKPPQTYINIQMC